MIDTGSQDCNWEIDIIAMQCTYTYVVGLQFQLRDVVTSSIIKNPISESSQNMQIYNIPIGVYITSINIGTTPYLQTSYVTSISFTLSNGGNGSLSCSNPKQVTTVNFSSLERITGYYVTQNSNYFMAPLTFYVNKLQPLNSQYNSSNNTTSYYRIIQKSNGNNSTTNSFSNVGPYGNTFGISFEDPYFYGNWQLTQILIATDGNSILSLQTSFTNILFYYVQVTDIHGNTSTNANQLRTVNVPSGCLITSVAILTDKNNNLVGICFYFSDNSSSGYIGQSYISGNGTTVTTYILKTNEMLMGFFGFETNTRINSLGLMIVRGNITDYSKY